MKTFPILFLAISISVAAASPVVLPLTNPQQLIDSSCQQVVAFDGRYTKDYCISALNSVKYDHKAKMSMPTLGELGIEVLSHHVAATKGRIEQQLGAEKNPKVKNILKHCHSMYNEATHRVKEGKDYMELKNYMMADRTVSMIEGDGSECEALFEADQLKSPFTKENLDTAYLGTMATLFIRFFDKSFTPGGVPIIKV